MPDWLDKVLNAGVSVVTADKQADLAKAQATAQAAAQAAAAQAQAAQAGRAAEAQIVSARMAQADQNAQKATVIAIGAGLLLVALFLRQTAPARA